ncbi:MAG: hypothetical protein AUJ57_12080 [Zetaproteobacteria bacterium CG1_02_53_45]|nr:MAG: hypothetical protein AUJ57_12080 [Zetaproteobacteria bacterium CG1_02_53_45]
MRINIVLLMALLILGSAMSGCEMRLRDHHDGGYHSDQDRGDHDRGRDDKRDRENDKHDRKHHD